MRKGGIVPPMPPNAMPHIIARLIEIGLTEPAGMGVGPLSWMTIDAWQRLTGVALSPWEARLLRQLSIDYVAEGHRAEPETAAPPWHAPVTHSEISSEAADLRAALGSIA